jgi:hypothetical protein
MDYYCSKCGAEAFVTPELVVRMTCDHADATIIAPRTSVLFGEGGALTLGLRERAALALAKILRVFC